MKQHHPVRKAVQAKHVPADALVAFVAAHEPCNRWKAELAFPQFPPKVLLAKFARLVNNGTLDGCACGCGGAFRVLHPVRSDSTVEAG